MISVQNLLRLLSGNKTIIVFFLGLLFFSCGTPRKTTRRTTRHKPRTHTKKPKVKKSKVDTIKWTKIDKTESKGETTLPSANIKSNYTISIFMPLKGKSSFVEGEDENVESYINYYAGIKMALQDLDDKGACFNVKTYDDQDQFEKRIYKSTFKENDVVIGPRKKDKLKKLISVGKRDEILVVSPWLTSSKLTKNNPYYLQLNPSTKHRYSALLEHAKQHFNNEDIILLQRESNATDKKRSKFFQKLNQTLDNNTNSELEVFAVHVDSLEQGETAFDSLIIAEEERDIAIILPNWSSKDEYYIYSVLRKLSVEKGLNKITVYGMSKILDSDLINYELYKNLNIRIAVQKYIDPTNQQVKEFRRRYFEEYNALATDDAIEGYDMMTFIGNNLYKYGNNFMSFLNEPQRILQVKYDIQSKHTKTDIKNENYENVQYYENSHLDIIEFDQDHFTRKD